VKREIADIEKKAAYKAAYDAACEEAEENE
jgi:hypothetical protein